MLASVKRASKNAMRLSHNVSIIVPSTVNTDSSTDDSLIHDTISHVKTYLANYFGGATTYPNCVGSWVSQQVGLVDENVCIVQSFATTDAINQNVDNVFELAEYVKSTMSQEAVPVIIDNELFLV